MSQTCIPLRGSTTCPAFSGASISTNNALTGLFPFLTNVTNTKSFDTQLRGYANNGYAVSKYQTIFGCSNINSDNPQNLYAQYTISFLCNAIVQNSINTCNTSPSDAQPLCADSCADFALSEQRIVSSPSLCGSPNRNAISQLRADFTNCALPANSITGSCVEGYMNEPDNCGFQSNLQGLCSFCRSSTVNSTDSCCVTSNTESRCRNVNLPVYTSMRPLFSTTTVTASPTSTSSGTPGGGPGGNSSTAPLDGGQIAGIVVGSVVGGLVLLGMLLCFCILFRRRRQQNEVTTLNQPTPPRSGGGVTQAPRPPQFEALPGARVTRMTALEGFPGGSPENNGTSGDSSGFDTSPESLGGLGASGVGAVPERKNNAPLDGSSPESEDYSSPENGAGQSERMSSFKDYYSSEEIHTGDLVSTLWAYQPRAPDEFELERGDMLKVVGIWDDGWATGVRVSMRAGDWSPSQRSGRDSVVSSDSARAESSGDSDIKAFPLVCVCLPQYWRTTIEGEPSSPPPSD